MVVLFSRLVIQRTDPSAEVVSVVPRLDLRHLVLGSVVPRHLSDLFLGEAEILRVLLLENRPDRGVVEPGEDSLLRHSQNARHDSDVAMLVVLQRAREKHAHEGTHFVVVPVRRRRGDRLVVFVDQDDGERL